MSAKENSLPPLNWLRAFEAAARHLSFTAAASELNMTQSAISQQIKNLEHHLGRPLFLRRVRSIKLTDAGFSYLPIVQDAFATLTAGTRMMSGGDRGMFLSVQCNLAFSVFWLAPRLRKLYEKHPWLVLNITTATWDPEPQSLDVEIRFGRNLEERFNAVKLNSETSFPVCTPQFAQKLNKWQDEALFDCTGVLANWENWARQRGEQLPRGKLVNLASTYSFSLNAALGHAGLAMGHDMLTGDLLTSGQLVKPYEESIPMDESYYLVEPPEHAKTPASRALIEWIQDEKLR